MIGGLTDDPVAIRQENECFCNSMFTRLAQLFLMNIICDVGQHSKNLPPRPSFTYSTNVRDVSAVREMPSRKA